MLSPFSRFLSLLALALFLNHPCIAQNSSAPDDTIHVTVTVNADGSRTTYQYDNAKHEATATTTEQDGKARGKIIYQIGEAGRFVSGLSFGPDDRFLFKALYKYDAAGRLGEETHLAKDERVINKIVYKYDAKGKQAGSLVFDGDGKLISGGASPSPTVSASKPRGALGR